MPLLTPEYFQSIPSFTKRYFEKLFDRLEVPSAVVFDNYQDVPESSEFHAMAAYGLGMVPEGIQVIILSRREPPKECIRLFANDSMHRLYWNDLRFFTGGVRGYNQSKRVEILPERRFNAAPLSENRRMGGRHSSLYREH